MNRPVALLMAVLALAGGAVVYFQFVAEDSRPGIESGDTQEIDGTRGAGASGEQGREAPDETEGAYLPEGVLKGLRALGVAAPRKVDGRAVIVGRVVALKEGADPEAVPGTKVERFTMGDDGVPLEVAEETVPTTAEGWFFLTVDTDIGHRFVATADAMQPVGVSVPRANLSDGSEDLGVLLLGQAASVEVSVTSGIKDIGEELAPVVGLELIVASEAGEELARGKTGKEGTVVFADLPPGMSTFTGSLTPYGKVEKSIALVGGRQELKLNIQVVGQLKVRVRAPSGDVLKSFMLCTDLQHATYAYVPPNFKTVEGDDDGWVIIEDIKAHQHTVFATAKGYALGRQEGVIVSAGETTEVTVDLPPGFSIKGKVVTRKGQNPVADAVVYSETDLVPYSVSTHTRDEFRPIARATRTRPDGSFTLEDLSEGSHKVTAMHADHAPGTNLSVTVGPDNASKTVVIELSVGASMHGHCFTAEGGPDVGAMVGVISFTDSNMKKKPPPHSFCDKDGAYRVEHIPEMMGGVFRQSTQAKGPPDFKQQSFKNGVDAEVNFGEPGTGSTLAGKVTREDGSIVKGRIVMLMSTEVTQGIPLFYQAVIDAEGKYEIRGVKGGDYFIQLGLAGRGSDFAGREPITMPGTGLVYKDIIYSGGDVKGRVLSKDTGKPLTAGEVAVMKGNDFMGRGTMTPDGSYLIPNVPEGTYQLMFGIEHHGVHVEEGVVVKAGTVTTVPDVRIAGGGRIVGQVVDKNGNPVAGAQITMRDPQTQVVYPAWSFGADSAGNFEVTYVPAQTYGVSATAPGKIFEVVSVTVTIGGAPTVVIPEK